MGVIQRIKTLSSNRSDMSLGAKPDTGVGIGLMPYDKNDRDCASFGRPDGMLERKNNRRQSDGSSILGDL